MERNIGEVGHKIRSKKEPFAHMANEIFERELSKILCLYYPRFNLQQNHYKSPIHTAIKPMKIWRVQRKGQAAQADQEQVRQQLQAICSWLGRGIVPADIKQWKRWGKIKLRNGYTLQSCLSVSKGQSTRFQKWFEATTDSNQPYNLIFGEALAFYEIRLETTQLIAVYHPLESIDSGLGYTRGRWSSHIAVLDVEKIIDIVGIWLAEKTKRVYILRKHPGLALLTADECGKEDLNGAEGGDPDDVVDN
ncbi:hypothetical protein BD779DRAFT_1469283 [Infundibulicybe gibba]|nr:hypothetical protein BD779DRAFT_1469283 [Infundibulicybe gibba]